MAAFRLYSQLQTFYGNDGTLLAGGSLSFYAAGTTTPQNVYGEKALTTNNGATVALDASGRLVNEVWGDTDDGYFVELYNAAAVKQGEEDNVEVPGGAGQTVPVPSPGEFLTGDGTNFAVATIRQVPDPTGQSTKILGNDGTATLWVAKPADGAAGTSDTASGTGYFSVGTQLLQYGNDAATAGGTGSKSVSKAVAFATAFAAAPAHVSIETSDTGNTPSGVIPSHSVTAISTTGFTVTFSTKTGGTSADSFSGSDITSAVNFKYSAVGTKV